MVVVAAGAGEGGFIVDALLNLESQDVAPEPKHALEVGDLQVDVSNVGGWVDDIRVAHSAAWLAADPSVVPRLGRGRVTRTPTSRLAP